LFHTLSQHTDIRDIRGRRETHRAVRAGKTAQKARGRGEGVLTERKRTADTTRGNSRKDEDDEWF